MTCPRGIDVSLPALHRVFIQRRALEGWGLFVLVAFGGGGASRSFQIIFVFKPLLD